MIPVTNFIYLNEDELEFTFIRAPGPGGQNVNKVASAVQMRFNVRTSQTLPDEVKERLERIAGQRCTTEGVIVINARTFRSQERNKQDAVLRLVELIRQASQRKKARKPTQPSFAAKQERLEKKTQRGRIKQLRRKEKFLD